MNFKMGKLVVTRSVNEKIYRDAEFAKFILISISKYKMNNWGDICKEDKLMNDLAVKNNDDRILARYNYGETAIYIITEYNRTVTTILFTDEY